MPLPDREPEPPQSPEELFGRLQVGDPGIENLWSQQADVLRSYADEHVETPDVALELPTGSGKTLVGLLIGEWRRLSRNERSAYVCPNNQLAAQVHGKAQGYGIDTVLLIGPSDQWSAADEAKFTQSRAVAVTNYHHVFNRSPRIVAQSLILDDAHTAESPVADRWSLRLNRDSDRSAYFSVIAAVSPELPEHHRRAVVNDDLDPVQRSKVEVLLPDAVQRVTEPISAALDEHVPGTNAWFAWDAIGASLPTCLIYASWSQVLIRPFIAPTFAQDAFEEAGQRVYLSATLGAGGELERSFGRSSIARVPQPADWDREGSGRRYILAPGTARDGVEANNLIRQITERIGRVLFLSPSDWRLSRAADAVLPDGLERLGAEDIARGLESFTSKERAALVLANRYDGIDLPGNACRLIILSGLPFGTHLQERFLYETLWARHALGERIRTRITQGVGRATRARRDTAVVLLHGDDLLGFLSQTDVRTVLRSELQAELELAFSTAELADEELLTSVDSFLAQDADWRPTEAWLRAYAQEHEKGEPTGSEQLTKAAPREVEAWQAAWRGEYEGATTAAQKAVAELNHPDLGTYRAWWVTLAASWSIMASGPEAPSSRELAREAGLATRRMRWRPKFEIEQPAPSADDALAIRADTAIAWLRRWYRSPKFERELSRLEEGIQKDEATGFELAVEFLGTILGFEAKRPAEEADPDGAWRDGDRAWLIWEAKTEELPDGKVSAAEVRQANSHADWIRHHFAWPEPGTVVTLLVTPKTEAHENVAGVPAEELHRVSPTTVREIAADAVSVHRQLAGELVGMSDEEAAARLGDLWTTKKLTTADLVVRVTDEPLR